MDAAVAGARAAFETWSRPPCAPASDDHGARRRDRGRPRDLKALESSNVGKPVSIIDFEFDLTVDNFPLLRRGSPLPGGTCGGEYLEDHTSFVRRDLLGVVASIAQMELPAQHGDMEDRSRARHRQHRGVEALRLTPAHRDPDWPRLAADIFRQVVFNVVPGPGQVRRRRSWRTPDVAMVSITGDVSTGKLIAQAQPGRPSSGCTWSWAAKPGDRVRRRRSRRGGSSA